MQRITDEDLFQRLAFDNPWWDFGADTEIKFRHPPQRVFFPSFFARVMKSGAGEVLILAGPLRAGKTVLLRQLVAKLIENGVPPASVFYCSLTTPSYTAADMKRLVNLFVNRHGHGPNSQVYVFFDEVQYAGNWEKTLLDLARAYPQGRFVGAVSSGAPSITTGGSSSDGRVSVFVLPPLTFLEFLRFRNTEKPLFGADAKKAGAAMAVPPGALDALNIEFHRYVNFGGFLEGVLAKAEGAPAPAFIRDGVSDRVLHKDLASLSGINDARELNRLFAILALNTAREVTIEELAKTVGVAKNTLRKYLDFLERAFLIRRLPRVDRSAKRFQRAVAFKVYLTSPCLYAALFGPVPPDHEAFPRLAETALVCQWLGSETVANLAYASWRGGGIDLLSLSPNDDKPDHVYEIDWGDAYATAGKSKGPSRLAGFVKGTNPKARAYVLTRAKAGSGTMEGTEVTLVPLGLYAYWLDRDPTLRNFHSRD